MKCFKNGMQIELTRASRSKPTKERKQTNDLVVAKTQLIARINQPEQVSFSFKYFKGKIYIEHEKKKTC